MSEQIHPEINNKAELIVSTEGIVEKEKVEQIESAFILALNELKNEWEAPKLNEIKIIIQNGNDYRQDNREGHEPKTWPKNYLIRGGKVLQDGTIERYVVCHSSILDEAEDAEKQIKHETAHLVIEQLVGNREAYKKSYLLEEGLAGLDGSTDKLIQVMQKESISLKKLPNPLEIHSMEDARQNTTDSFTDGVAYLVMFSFGNFVRDKLGAKETIALYKSLAIHPDLESAYKAQTGDEINLVISEWLENIEQKELVLNVSKEIAVKLGVEYDSKINAILFDSKEELAKAFIEYTQTRAKELNIKAPGEPPSYLIGWNPPGKSWNEAWVVKPGIIDEVGTVMDKAHFERLLKHEMTHAYLKALTGKRDEQGIHLPSWLNEGVAYWIAEQKPKKLEGDITIDRLRALANTFDPDKFPVGYEMVNLIIKNFGKEKLKEIIRIGNNQEKLEDELKRMFDWLK